MPSNTKKKTSRPTSRSKQPQQPQLWRRIPISRPIVLALFVLASTVGLYYGAGIGHAAQAELKSGVGGNLTADTPGNQCLDSGHGSQFVIATCNGAPSQRYSYDGTLIHIGSVCAVEAGASPTSGQRVSRAVVGGSCSTNPVAWGAAWTKSGGQFHNNHATGSGSPYCMDVSGSQSGGPVIIYPCKSTSSNGNERWYPDTWGSTSGGGGGGNGNVVTEAEKYIGLQENLGQNRGDAKINGASVNIINQNTGQPWCAYFVSYVYWKTGHQLNGGTAYNPIGLTGAISGQYQWQGITGWFHRVGKFYINTSTNRTYHAPQAGDFVNYGNGTHSGIVQKVVGTTLYSVDGNYSDTVKVHVTYDYGSSDVTGWGKL